MNANIYKTSQASFSIKSNQNNNNREGKNRDLQHDQAGKKKRGQRHGISGPRTETEPEGEWKGEEVNQKTEKVAGSPGSATVAIQLEGTAGSVLSVGANPSNKTRPGFGSRFG